MPERYTTDQDKNFDDLSHHFNRNIYGKLKGDIRLAVLNRDLAPYLTPEKSLRIVDAGGGQGQFALSLAEQGHELSICDISNEMLNRAKQSAEEKNLHNIKFFNCPFQTLQKKLDFSADIALCHAVLEWLAKPESALKDLAPLLAADGILSLAFFNQNAIVYKNLLKANFYKANSEDFTGVEGSLTPYHPLQISDVLQWCQDAGFEVLGYSGIRVFHDYIMDQATRNRHPEALVEAELKFSQIEPYRSLGRYIHIVAKKLSED